MVRSFRIVVGFTVLFAVATEVLIGVLGAYQDDCWIICPGLGLMAGAVVGFAVGTLIAVLGVVRGLLATGVVVLLFLQNGIPGI